MKTDKNTFRRAVKVIEGENYDMHILADDGVWYYFPIYDDTICAGDEIDITCAMT